MNQRRYRRWLRRRIHPDSHAMNVGDRLTVKTAQREVIRVGPVVVPVSRWQWFEYVDWPWPE